MCEEKLNVQNNLEKVGLEICLMDCDFLFFPPNLMLRRRSKNTESQASPLDKRYFCLLLLQVRGALDARSL